MTYIIVLKVTKFDKDKLNLLKYSAKTLGGGGQNAPPQVQVGLTFNYVILFCSRFITKPGTKALITEYLSEEPAEYALFKPSSPGCQNWVASAWFPGQLSLGFDRDRARQIEDWG